MKCPVCGVDNDKVIDSRSSQDGFSIRRRRECFSCHRRYTTHERIEEPAIKVIKKDGVRVPFERIRVQKGLEKACWKRPISHEQIEAVVVSLEDEIYASGEPEIESRQLGALVMGRLKKLDQVAYVRFASVYRRFEDAQDFVEELRPILAESKNKMDHS